MQIRERTFAFDSNDTATIYPAVAGCILRVIHLAFTVAGDGTVLFRSDGTDSGGGYTALTGTMAFADKGQFLDRSHRPNGGLFASRPGEALNVDTNAQICGYGTVQIIPVTT